MSNEAPNGMVTSNDPDLHPADRRVAAQLGFLGDAIESRLNGLAGEHYGYILMTIPFNRIGAVFHIGNMSNEQAAHLLRSHAAMLESLPKGDANV